MQTHADPTSGTSETHSWEERWSERKNRFYYFDRATGQSTWEKPLNVPIAPSTNKPDKKIRATHLLVKHRESRRPSSWKEIPMRKVESRRPNWQSEITRSKEDAYAKINEFRERIARAEISIQELAKTESDCSSARNGGDLGFFGPGQMQGIVQKRFGKLAQCSFPFSHVAPFEKAA
ncbi:Peptidyl-prolyl cis-trans isomerase NIMA-interacting protein 1 [Borealophlyctis nickersoniae]|nr:Peptidyl-prolyl cis-trans isomerase NIMA-interacting protein 1 [Borealophlyctis nickersoniae]